MFSMMEVFFSAPRLCSWSVAAVVRTIHEVQLPHFLVEVVRLGPIRQSVWTSRSPRVRSMLVMCLGC